MIVAQVARSQRWLFATVTVATVTTDGNANHRAGGELLSASGANYAVRRPSGLRRFWFRPN